MKADAPVAEPEEPVVSDRVIDAVLKAFFDWVWQQFCQKPGRTMEKEAPRIGMTAPGLAKVLRRQTKMYFGTFIRTCFLRRERESRIEVDAEGWKIEVQWRIERPNKCLVSEERKRR